MTLYIDTCGLIGFTAGFGRMLQIGFVYHTNLDDDLTFDKSEYFAYQEGIKKAEPFLNPALSYSL